MTLSTSGYGVLYQSLTGLVPGETYNLSFDYKIASAVNAGSCAFYFSINGDSATSRITTTAMAYIRYSGSSSALFSTSWETLSTTYAPTSTSIDLYLLAICAGNSRIPQAMPQVYYDSVQFSNDNVEIETCTTSTYTSTVTIASSSTLVNIPPATATSAAVVSSAAFTSQTLSSTFGSSRPSSPIAASSTILAETPKASITNPVIVSSIKASQTTVITPGPSPSSSVLISGDGPSTSTLPSSSLGMSSQPDLPTTPVRTPTVLTRRPKPSSSRVPIPQISSSGSLLKESSTTPSLILPTLPGQPPVSSVHIISSTPSKVAASSAPPTTFNSGSSLSHTVVISSADATFPQSTQPAIQPSSRSRTSHDASSIYGASSADVTNIASSTIPSTAVVNSSSKFPSVPVASGVPGPSSVDTSEITSSTVAKIQTSTGTDVVTGNLPSSTYQGQTSLMPTATVVSQSGINESAPNGGFTTSTIFSTRTATITGCPSSITDCPAFSKTTYVTTETIILSTTICPVTATEVITPTGTSSSSVQTAKNSAADKSSAVSEYATITTPTLSPLPQITDSTFAQDSIGYTTSTIFSTRTATITACPSSSQNCPASSKTTYLTTDTVIVSTTICPVAVSSSTEAGNNPSVEEMTMETLLTTVTKTITACPSTVTDCPDSQRQTYTTTETLVAGTTAYPVTPTEQSVGQSASSISTMRPSIISASSTGNEGEDETTTITIKSTVSAASASGVSFVDENAAHSNALGQITDSQFPGAAAISTATFSPTSASIQSSSDVSRHSLFTSLSPVSGSSSTLTSQRSSTSSSSTSTQTYANVASASSAIYNGSASHLQFNWLKTIVAIFVVLFF
ncbi:uncharacterized protein N7511_007696 [Penicillium nucicola]|uniref:uncharacterized protein n=1 Tax=Penicillium nucicola TaxID=1850975 RepID=UPI002545A313|nr:uncharacterized protein N7511_007696 [Penicillium nucicola]KAJ5753543.1 hypothetical protein N7511_007696 [Penicillium nucicola]